MRSLAMLAHLGRRLLAAVEQAWSCFWFESRPTTPLEVVRIGVGSAMLINYILISPYLLFFWGEAGWVPLRIAREAYDNDPWRQSVFYYFSDSWQWIVFHVVFLLCCAAFTLGWRTRWVKWLVLVGQISYAARTPAFYGVDEILACLLFILCLAPIGRSISLDRVRAVRAVKSKNLEATLPPFASPWAGACTRLMQIQMAVLFFYSAIGKRGDDWYNGDALWVVFTNMDYYNKTMLDLLASHYWLVNLATYGTLLVEIAFPFLIWQRATRPYLLVGAVFLHIFIGVYLDLFYFSFVMIMGHMSFLYPDWLARLGQWWKRRMGESEMVYDGQCASCIRSLGRFVAFDGLQQIELRNFRTNPSPIAADEPAEKAPYIVLPCGRTLPGFEAYRYAVLRIPGLWWLIPLFYVPVLSRLLGRPICNWIASNRSRLASMAMMRPGPV